MKPNYEAAIKEGFTTNPIFEAFFHERHRLIEETDAAILQLEGLKASLEKTQQILRELPALLIQASSS